MRPGRPDVIFSQGTPGIESGRRLHDATVEEGARTVVLVQTSHRRGGARQRLWIEAAASIVPIETAFDSQAGANIGVLYNRADKMSPPAVARAEYDGMNGGRKVVLPGVLTKLLAVAGELPPRGFALAVNRRLWSPTKTTRR